jgi:TolB-like protein
MISKIIFAFLFLNFSSLLAQQNFIAFSDTANIPDENYNFRSKPNIAVLPFYDANAQAKEVEFGRTISAMLATAMRGKTNFIVQERGELNQILPAQVEGVAGLSHDFIRLIHDQYDVEVLLTGDVSLINTTLHIDVRLIETSNAKIVVALYSTCQDLTKIRQVVVELAQQLEQTYLRQWMGRVTISSDPPGAEVYMEDNFVGMTVPDQPLKIDNMLEGKYQLKFIKGGYYNWQGDISVLAKMERSVKVSLIAKPGSMNIYSEPQGAQIFVDNNIMGITPMSLKKVAEGEHEIRLVKENFKEWTRRVVVQSFQPTDVKATLDVSPGVLTVNSSPPGASINFKGKHVAETPHTLSNLTPGEVVIHVNKPGYESWTTSVFITPNSHEHLDIKLKEMRGTFTISSKPGSAAVYLKQVGTDDKKFIGYTPIVDYETTIGDYLIEVDKDNYFIKQEKMTVYHNQMSDVGIELEEKPGTIFALTSPPNARVFLDGTFKGRSPIKLKHIPKGSYKFSMNMPYAREEKLIVVKPNQETKVSSSFKKSADYLIPATAIGVIILTFQLLAN